MKRKIDLNGAKRVHFIGIGGISMSGFAEILKRDGFDVSGSDDVCTEITKRLEKLGIKIAYPNAAENIADDIEIVVYSAAIKPENPEFKEAAVKGKYLIERAAFIGKVLKGYDPICVAGTHGKTTTTSMIAEVLLSADYDPTIQIGGHMNRGGMNYRVGESKYFVLESCEYSNSFHHWQPLVGVILNIDADHLDFFGSMDNLIAAFGKFAQNIRNSGALIIQAGLSGYDKIINGLECDIITFGLNKESGAMFYAENIQYIKGKPFFNVMKNGEKLARVALPLPGECNMLNALACFASVYRLGVTPLQTENALSSVKGTKRRFEHKGDLNGIKIMDDYAHHPTEIRACLKAVRQSIGNGENGGKIVCLFQPHTYTRTRNLFNDFVTAFSDADTIVLLPIYAAREPNDPSVSSEILTEAIKNNGGDVKFAENFDEAGNYLKKILRSGDMLITMGAGEAYKVGDNLLSEKLSTLSTDIDE